MSDRYWLVRHDGTRFPFGEQGITIGRHSANNIVIRDPAVSRQHARILVAVGKCWIRDENSAGGTYVNQQRVQGQQELKPGDVLRVGKQNFRLVIAPEPQSVSGERKPISKASEAGTSDLFISYSRIDMPFVRQLHGALTTAGKDVWVDWQDIPPSAEWEKELQVAIREANAFVFIISPDSAASTVCREEINHAIANNKRIIPIVRRSTPREQLPPEINKINWIFMQDQDEFEVAVQTLIIALETDLAYLRVHTRLQIRAAEWEAQQRSNSLTLRGEDLSNAEAFLTTGVNIEPHPTALQVQYITASRQVQTRNQRRLLIGVSTALVITIILGMIAFWQFQLASSREEARATQQAIAEENEALAVAKEEARATQQAIAEENEALAIAREQARATQQAIAEEEKRIALSNSLAAQARLLYEDQLDLALLLGVLASQINPGAESRNTLHDALEYRSNLKQFIHSNFISTPIMRYSTDGSQLIIVSGDGEIRSWDLESGQPVGETIQFQGETIFDVVIGQEDQIWLLGLDQETLFVWDASENRMVGSAIQLTEDIYPDQPGLEPPVRAGLSPDGKTIAAGDLAGFINFYDIASGTMFGKPDQQHGFPISTVAFSPDGEVLATAGNEWKIYLWDAVRGEHITIWDTSHTRNITSLAFSSDGQFLASGSEDGTVNVFDRTTGVLLEQQPSYSITTGQAHNSPASGHPAAVRSLAFTADGEWLISGAQDGDQLIWMSRSNLHTTDIPRPTYTGSVQAIASHPFGSEYVVSGSNGVISIWQPEFENWRLGASTSDMLDVLDSIEFVYQDQIHSSDQNTTTGGIFDTPARIEGLDPTKEMILLADCNDQSLSTDQPCPEGKLQLLNSQSLEPVSKPYTGLTGWPEFAAFSPDQKWLAVVSCPDRGTVYCTTSDIHVWDTTTESLMFQKNFPDGITRITFSPDNRFLAVGGFEQQLIYLWDLEFDQITALSVARLPADLRGLAFSPDGSSLAAVVSFEDPGPYANTIYYSQLSLWGLPDVKVIGQVDMGYTTVYSLAYSSDSKYIQIDHDRDISLWQLDLGFWQKLACRIANRNLTEQEWARFVIGETYREVCPEP